MSSRPYRLRFLNKAYKTMYKHQTAVVYYLMQYNMLELYNNNNNNNNYYYYYYYYYYY